ncbi:hypothetical protein C667_06841 [Thauera phenylacetica B4P]|uniref:Uncharacterized protein n=1 Tax=Thauera phenylacetica B4P TaxID=1234382 RepID=N6ZU40_9RHOO|nr:hypothetical protein C667_06841 [Thauera phenylacetica B4P]
MDAVDDLAGLAREVDARGSRLVHAGHPRDGQVGVVAGAFERGGVGDLFLERLDAGLTSAASSMNLRGRPDSSNTGL